MTAAVDRPKNRFIDPKVLIRIQNMELVARTVVEGFVTGLHQSPYMGFSVDFAEYRAYRAGDEYAESTGTSMGGQTNFSSSSMKVRRIPAFWFCSI